MPQVFNKRIDGVPQGAILVDRTTKWGNPFHLERDGNRTEVISKFRVYLYESGLWIDLPELRGLDLVCWCKPEPCHADVLLVAANQ